ncbi:MAG: hypothetical protein AAFV43_11295 [Planctomycetota bacterium]
MAVTTPQPIAGVTPASVAEATVANVWPSIAAGPLGRALGRLYGWRLGVRIRGVPLTIGWLMVVLTAPLAGLLFLARKAPRKPLVLFGPVNPDAVCYRLTNRGVQVVWPLERNAAPAAAITHADYDDVRIEVLPGQAWYPAGDVVFLHGETERLRLAGVPRPDPFVELCRKTHVAATIGR